MFSKLLFRLRYRRLKKVLNPLKLFVEECAGLFARFLAKDRSTLLDEIGNLIERDRDLKNVIDDYGLPQAPEQPPFSAVEFENMKRIKRTNFLLMVAFILCEGAFNYFALRAMLPGHNVFIDVIRIATAIIISLMALFLVENFITTHFKYLELKHRENLTVENKSKLVRLRSKRNLYFSASIVLFIVLVALGIVREFIIAGGVTLNVWIMLVTVGIAVIVAIALGLQGAEVEEIIHKYRVMVKWQKLKRQIDDIEKEINMKLYLIQKQMESELNNHWLWLIYLKRWLLREYDDDDMNRSEDGKKGLVYTSYEKFVQRVTSQSQNSLDIIERYQTEYQDELLNFGYEKLREEKR